MLNERKYMREQPGSQQSLISGKKMLLSLVVVNAMMFILFSNNVEMIKALAVSVDGIKEFKLYTLFSAMFVHTSFMHVFFSMWALYIFGGVVAPYMGGARFLAMYIISGIVGNLFWLVMNWNVPGFGFGSSSAVFGVMLTVAVLLPQARFMLIFFPAPIRITTMVLVFAAIEILSEIQHTQSIAGISRLGGAIGAYIYLKIAMSRFMAWDPLRKFSPVTSNRRSRPEKMSGGPKLYRNPEQQQANSEQRQGRNTDNNAPVNRGELDRLLEKISRSGINSLSEEEMVRLRKAREQMHGDTTQS